LPFLSTPVKEIWFSNEPILNEHLLETGGAVLDEYTMLSPPDEVSYAIGKEEFRSWKTLPLLDKQYGNFTLEVWHYDPLLLSGTNAKTVDKLSLYLSMQGQSDERVLAALSELINTIEW
jgi:hypothetical protein